MEWNEKIQRKLLNSYRVVQHWEGKDYENPFTHPTPLIIFIWEYG